MMTLGNGQIQAIIAICSAELRLFGIRTRIRWHKFMKRMPNLRVWFKKNWPGVTLELGITFAAAFLGFMVGLFIGFVTIINNLGV